MAAEVFGTAAGLVSPGVVGAGQGAEVGVGGYSGTDGYGVFGTNIAPSSDAAFGVVAIPGLGPVPALPDGAGVYGFNGGSGPGVQGTAGPNGNATGVVGVNTGAGTGVYGSSVSGNAVAGNSQTGNAGIFESQHGTGVYASSLNTQNGIGVYAQGAPAGHFQGDVRITGDVILVNSPNSNDIAEDFDLEDGLLNAEPGTVLVICGGGKLSACAEPYDTRVAGVVSGAGELRPAVVLGRLNDGRHRSPIALIGKVVCKVDAGFGSIEAGDLLTTSPTLGRAMKVTDRSKALGAILGKALRPHAAGHGMVPILVSMR